MSEDKTQIIEKHIEKIKRVKEVNRLSTAFVQLIDNDHMIQNEIRNLFQILQIGRNDSVFGSMANDMNNPNNIIYTQLNNWLYDDFVFDIIKKIVDC